jgi:hypothetical protein
MKKIITLVGLLAIIASCSTKPSGNLQIQGTIKGLKKGTLYLQQLHDSTMVALDSIELNGDGNFMFDTSIDEAQLLYLNLERKDDNEFNDRIRLFAEPGQITVNTNWNTFDINPDVSGSKSHEVFEGFQKMMSRFNNKNLELMQQAIAFNQEGDQAGMDSILEVNNKNELRRYLFAINYALNNKESVVAPYIAVVEIPEANPKFLDSIYSVLPDEVANSKYGKQLKSLLTQE